MIIFIFGTSLILISSFFINSYLSHKRDTIDFLISWFSIFFAQIVLVSIILGITSRLFLPNIILAHLLICLFSYFLFKKYNYFQFVKPDFAFILENKLLLLSISAFLGFFSVKFFLNLLNPSVYPDTLQYHLTFPAIWIKNGNLNNPMVVFDKNNPNILNALTYFPLNGEFLFFWLMLPLKNAFLADVGQAPFYIIGILAIYSILKKFGVKKNTSLFTGLLWTLIPNIHKQIEYGALVDVMCAALFLVVFNHLISLDKDFSLKNALLLGISTGLFIGTKAINIFWCLALLPIFIYILARKKAGFYYISQILTVIALATIILGAFSYIRNFILTNNLFYPIEVKLFGKVIMPGAIDKITYSKFLVPWEEFKLRNMFFSEGLGLQFLAFIFPGTFIPLILSFLFRKKVKDIFYYILIFFIPALMFAMYIFYIKAYWVRYFFPYLGAGFICSIIFLDKFKWGAKYINILGGLCVLSSISELAGHTELITSLSLSTLIFLIFLSIRKGALVKLNKYLCFRHYIFLFFIFAAIFYLLNSWYDKREFSRYPLLFSRKEIAEKDVGLAWKWLNENTGEGKRIAYAGRAEFYPLFGTHLKNDVFYVSVNDKPSIPHYYPDGDYRKEQNFTGWLRNLSKERIDLLVVYQMHGSEFFPIEDKWSKEYPDRFRLIFENPRVRIYSLVKS